MAKAKNHTPAKTPSNKPQVIAHNRKVRHEYHVVKSYEAGVVLAGSEVKSLRAGDVQWADSHARYDTHGGELWLHNLYIGPYRDAGYASHMPTAIRKLLLHRREIHQIAKELHIKGTTIVPREILLRGGWVKIEICVVRGKQTHDKRRDLINRTLQREAERSISQRL